MTMENQSKEKKRVSNIIWNASEDYTFLPDFEVYDGKGEANLYWNYIVGAVRRYYDYAKLQEFFRALKSDPDYVFYESLTWIGLENCTYEKGVKDRPVLEHLRRSYSTKVLHKEDTASFYSLIDEIKLAHFRRGLGEEITESEQVTKILDDLEFHDSMTTDQIILKMNEIIRVYFPLKPARKRRNSFLKIHPRNKKLHFSQNQTRHLRNPFHDTPLLSLFNFGSADIPKDNYFFEPNEKKDKKSSLWRNLKDQWERKQRENIQNNYGISILTEPETKALEQVLCTESHKNCHLHFTRGEFDGNVVMKIRAGDRQKFIVNQRERNKAYYLENIARNSHSIEKLTSVIRNALLTSLETSRHKAKAGHLIAREVWRNIYLYDDKVFQKNVIDEIGNLSVDIMLDASGSQIDRQEKIAAQGFIIAESLTRCRIPVKVYSFCTNNTFTVINLFRDYNEVNNNGVIFHYHSSGCNRDGLAVRTALHLMDSSPSDHKILIILSDGKPLDPQGFPTSRNNPDEYIYADAPAINDTAKEVRMGWQKRISVLCVFTGADGDIPAAKRMYGHNLVCIQSPEKFADVVGILMRNVLKNL